MKFLVNLEKNMKTIPILFFISALFAVSCLSSKNKEEQKEKISSESDEFQWYSGQIFTKPFINKIGKEHIEIQEYYFRSSGKSYFIKLSSCQYDGNISSFNGNYVKAKGEIRNGLWDTDNPNEQSRVGEYFVFSEIKIVERPVSIHFSDGNSNNYVIGTHLIRYEPVQIIESSSGTYSGSIEKERVIDTEDYMNIFFMMENIYSTDELATVLREKGTSSLLITYTDRKENFLILDCPQIHDLKAYIDSLLNRGQ